MSKKRKPTLRLQDIRASEYNPRQINRDSATALRESMREFGDLSGIVFNIKTGNLVTGHQRWNGLKKRHGTDNMTLEVLDHGSAKVVCDGEECSETWPIRLVDWSLHREMAASIAANSAELTGEFTDDLEDVLHQVRESNEDLYADLLMMRLETDAVAEKKKTTDSQLSGLEYRVIVTCADENDQAALYERLREEGLTCKLMTS